MSTSFEFTGSANGLKSSGTPLDLIDDRQGVLERSSSVRPETTGQTFENRMDEGRIWSARGSRPGNWILLEVTWALQQISQAPFIL
jgi:hypothetical protein